MEKERVIVEIVPLLIFIATLVLFSTIFSLKIAITIAIIAVLVWFIKSLKIIGPAEMAVKVILGVPIKFCDSGLVFVPWFFGCKLVRYPKKIYSLDYPKRKVYSKEGTYKKKKYAAIPFIIDAVAYMSFPRGSKLIEILRSQIPTDEEKLKDWTEEAVDSALRTAIGRITWREAIEDIETLKRNVDAIFKAKDGALIKAGFREEDIKLAIEEIKLPENIEESLSKVEREKFESEAAEYTAKKRAIETIKMVLQSMAQSRGKSIEEIQKEIDKDPKLREEFLKNAIDLLQRQIAIDGKSFIDIRVQGAEGLEKMILEALALWKKLTKEKEKRKEDKKEDKEIEAGLKALGLK